MATARAPVLEDVAAFVGRVGETRANGTASLRDRIAAFRAEHPMPRRTGKKADKAFFDDLSGAP